MSNKQKMQTRSGVCRMPSGWPSVYEAQKNVKNVQTQNQLVRMLFNFKDKAEECYSLREKRLWIMTLAEAVLKFRILLEFGDNQEFQSLIDKIIEKFEECPSYVKKFKMVSDSHRLHAKRVYVISILKDTKLGVDIAEKVATFV